MAETRKKVLFLITKGKPGGAQRYVYDLASSLPREEFIPVVAFGEGGELGMRLAEIGVRTVRIPELQRDIDLAKDMRILAALARLCKDERPDVLHLNSSKVGLLGAIAGRLAGVPKIIFTAHGWASNEDRGRLEKAVLKFLHWLTVILSHRTIVVSQKTADDMSLPLARAKLSVVYNGVGPAELEPKVKVRTLLAPHVHEAVWIGTISELHRNKGIDFALRAFAPLAKRYPHVAYVVIGGSGTESGKSEREALEGLASELGIGEKVHFLGNVPDAGLFIKAFDVFALTSRTEALPYTILEAGRAETAVVASAVGGIPEIVTSGKDGVLVPPGNIDAITEALADLIEHPKKREQLGKRLASRIAKKFSIEAMVRQTVKAYKQ